jgi:hypothetical protein
VDYQRSTPLSVLRKGVGLPTRLLETLGVEHPARDRFKVERFPEDVYDLMPTSLAALDPGLSDVGIAWGAAKAMAHKQRHRPASGPG